MQAISAMDTSTHPAYVGRGSFRTLAQATILACRQRMACQSGWCASMFCFEMN